MNDPDTIINRCTDVELAKVVFNSLLRGEVPDKLDEFKRANYDEYNELVDIAKYLTNDNYYISQVGEIEEVTAFKCDGRYFDSRGDANQYRKRLTNVRQPDNFWIPKIGQTIYLTSGYKIGLRIVTDVRVRYSSGTRDCTVYHIDPKDNERDHDSIYVCFNSLEECCDW